MAIAAIKAEPFQAEDRSTLAACSEDTRTLTNAEALTALSAIESDNIGTGVGLNPRDYAGIAKTALLTRRLGQAETPRRY